MGHWIVAKGSRTHRGAQARASACLASFVLLVAGCGGPTAPNESTDSTAEAIQRSYVGIFESQTNYDVNLLTTSSQSTVRARSTGALRIFNQPDLDTASCGVSFVTHHFAVTAAHCVNTLSLGASILVQQFDTTNFNVQNIWAQSLVSGTWNGTGEQFDQYFRQTNESSQQGYVQNNLSCNVYAICDGTKAMTHCASIFTSSAQDIAILQCPGRSDSEHVTVASSNPPSGTRIEIRWFHEILDLQTYTGSLIFPDTQYEPTGNYLHYFLRDANNLNNNYHYHYNTGIDTRLQLYPLLSIHDKNNSPYKITSQGSVDWTDAPVCHGTSGSGYFVANTDTFLGPCELGSSGIINNLCDDFQNDLADGSQRSGYLDPFYTQQELGALGSDP